MRLAGWIRDHAGPLRRQFALVVAIVQQLLAGYVSPDYIEAYPYIILLVALILRPSGLIREATRVRY